MSQLLSDCASARQIMSDGTFTYDSFGSFAHGSAEPGVRSPPRPSYGNVNSGTPPQSWNGLRFRWSENLDDSMWASVIVEVERRGDGWVVTRLDRRREPLEKQGFEQL